MSDLIREDHQIRALVTELSRFFRSDGTGKKLGFCAAQPRLNIAGGEPLLFPSAVRTAVHQARRTGLRASLITNGSFLTEDLCKSLAPDLDMLGVSIDSDQDVTNGLIGRTDRCGRLLEFDPLGRCLDALRERNSSIKIKLNTVVNRLNWNEDLSALVNLVKPDKWKVLRALPVLDQSVSVTDEQFRAFVESHVKYKAFSVIEDNSDMTESYIMIDPQGRFFQNRKDGTGYVYSQPILEVGAEAAFRQMAFEPEKFQSRYVTGETLS